MRWRREPLHERLARKGGLIPQEALPHDTAPRWGETGIHGVARPREWDAVALAEAPDLATDTVHFAALPDGTLVVDESLDVPSPALDALADALEKAIRPPYRAEAVRRDERRFAVAARAIEVVEVPEEIDGDEIEVTVYGGEREFRIEGERAFGSVRSLEAAAEQRFPSYVLRAQRLDGALWEVRVAPL